MSTRDLELVQLVLRYRDYQRVVKRLAGIPVLLEKLRQVRASPLPPRPGPWTLSPVRAQPFSFHPLGPGLLRGDEMGVHQLG